MPIARAAVVVLAMLLSFATPGRAQPGLSGIVDLGYAPSYVWRGRALAEQPVVSAAASLQYDHGRGALSAGVWAAWGLRSAQQGAEAPRSSTIARPLEVDVWGQYTQEFAWTDVSVGLVHYGFSERGALDANEAYLQVWSRPRRMPVELKGTAYVGLGGGSATTYAELDASRWFSIIPIPTAPVAARVGATAGFNLSADGRESPRGFTSEGPTHLGLSGILTVAAGRLALYGGVRYQHNFQAATRPAAGVRKAPDRPWGEAGLSYSWGRGPQVR